MPTFYLIDGHAYLHRAYHALPPLTTSHGEPVNAVYGFLRMLLKILRQYKPDYVSVCFDTAAPTFRHRAYEAYKATRKEMDEALRSQLPWAREVVQALRIPVFEKDGYEADDLIASLTREAQKKGLEVVIVTGDKDALQLVNEQVKVLNEPKDQLLDREKVQERYGVDPGHVPDIFSLMGDASDNVPGVRGIGEKSAIKLIQQFGSLEELLSRLHEVTGKLGTLLKEHANDARRSLDLVRLNESVPMDNLSWDALRAQPPDPSLLSPLLQKLEFYSLLKELLPVEEQTPTSDVRYTTVLQRHVLKDLCERLSAAASFAIDTETTGIDPHRAGLVGISLAIAPREAFYIPVAHTGASTPAQIPFPEVQQALRLVLADPHVGKIGHHLKYDLRVLERHGLPLAGLRFDTMVASYCLNPSRSTHNLKDLALELLGQRMTPIEALIGKGSHQQPISEVDIERVAAYACADADMTLRLAQRFENEIQEKKLASLFHEVEMPLVPILAEMEAIGVLVDRAYLTDLRKEFDSQAIHLESEIYKLAGESFNINSPKQLSLILFEKLKLPVVRRTKTGFSTDEEVLQILSAQHALPAKLIQYREIQKLRSTYIDALLTQVDPETGRVHTSFNQTVTATGRLSSSDPNLQNIPVRSELGRQIRRAFIASEDHVLLSADYSQIDLRVLAHMSRDSALCETLEKGGDVHTVTACEIFGLSPQEITPEMRRLAKTINFGIIYGLSAFGLAQQLQITQEEAQRYIDHYFKRYAGVRAWMDQVLIHARQKGYVTTLLNRLRYLPEILSKNGAVRSFAERTAMNTPIQGTSADIIKVAMIQVYEEIQRGGWKARMLLQVHDELVFEVPRKDVAAIASKIRSLMEEAVRLNVPIRVDLKAGPNWRDLEPLKNV